MVGLLFPGQGSQFVGMGRDLWESQPAARAVFEEADDVLGFRLSTLCFEGPETELTRTHNAQPAILTHSMAVYRCVRDQLGDVALGAGHSLGELSAYVAAGSMSFADGVRTVRRRGELMLRSGESRPGTMAAVLGLEDAILERVCAEATMGDAVCVPANYNSPGQTVISGDVRAVENAIALLKAAGARRVVPLNVSGAFHSPLMAGAVAGLAQQLGRVTFEKPSYPIVSNVDSSIVTDAAKALELLQRQLTSAVRWTDGIRAMMEHGVRSFIEVGPGNVLTGLLRRIDRKAVGRAIGSVSDIEAVAAN